jgi:hypothetical protein
MPHVPKRDDDSGRDRYPAQPAHAAAASLQPRTDRSTRLSENTSVVIKAGAIAAAIVAVLWWFHGRIAAVEIKQAEQTVKIDAQTDLLREIRGDVRDLARKGGP